ncbi:chorismate-binding protein [Deinococcus radiomollis]|uniref:chorismate-binding protein n=1 Tax=Deinococcus radiomollis TaxID=468916 RepID=UPI00389297A3
MTVAVPALPTLPALSPDQALLRLHRRGVPGLVLLESLGPLTDQSGLTLLSAAPVSVRHTLPERPAGSGLFPAWIGGLKYEAALAWGLPTHPAQGEAQHWGEYPSGLVWDRRDGTLELVGEAHLDWTALLSGPEVQSPEALEVGPFSQGDLDYPAGVLAVQRNILAGEVYQVNLSRGVRASASGSPVAAYLRLRQDNPSPYMAYAELGGEVIVSCSPERLVRWQGDTGRGDTVSARPIAGTRARGATAVQDAELEQELLTDPKEAAEHLMLTDLIRHDLGWLSRPGTVNVPEYRSVERYSHVMHLVSEVQGTARPGLDMAQVLRATFPGGTITGAPKRRVMQEIAALEPGPRGWYTGSLGIVSGAKAELNILIRTAVFTPIGTVFAPLSAAAGETTWTVSVRAGAGVVMDSDPGRETRETELKAQALLEVLSGQRERQPAAPSVTPGRPWSPPAVHSPRHSPLKVLLLDNFDSFTQNLAHDLAAHGAEVLLRSNAAPLPELQALRPDAVLVGPGPGTPQSSGVTLPLTRACLERSIPLLGVCLGHQALGEALGGRVVRAAQALHGMPEAVQHSGRGLFAGVPQGAVFTRYHSLILDGLPPEVRVTATSQAGEVMALEVRGAAAWGVQFHPESLLSEYGRTLLGNWLTLAGQHQEDRHETAAR